MSDADTAWWAWFWGEIEHWAFLVVVLALAIEFAALKLGAPYKEKLEAAKDLKISEANTRAADAIKAAEDERLARVKIEQEIIKQLKPRDFTTEQFDNLVSAIKGKVKQLTVYTLTDAEAARFGLALIDALQKSDVRVDWMRPTVQTEVFMVEGVSGTGITLYVDNVREDPQAKELVELMMAAFVKSGVMMRAFMPEKPLPGIPSPSLFVAKQQTPFDWFPEHLAPPGLPRPPWESK